MGIRNRLISVMRQEDLARINYYRRAFVNGGLEID